MAASSDPLRCDHTSDPCAPHSPDAAAQLGEDDHEHDHDHGDRGHGSAAHGHAGHAHGSRHASRPKLLLVLGLTSVLMIVELIGGYLTHSLALIADAGHMLSDVASQGLALLALWFASKPPTSGKSYGYYRTEILASLVNGVILVGISCFILYEAITRLTHPPEVNGLPMLGVAVLGLIVNSISMRVLHNFADSSLNIKAAYLELMGDLLASAGVVVAAILIAFTHWYIADPLISLCIGILILPRTWLLLAESTNILMEGTPGHIDLDKLHTALLAVPGVLDVHDIHVWTITSGLDAMSGHVCVARDGSQEAVLGEVTRIAKKQFGIHHTTIQVETVEPR